MGCGCENNTEMNKKTTPRITVEFEDCGQDLLEMDIEDGIIVDARPFHKTVFEGCMVVDAPKTGGYLTYMYGIEENTIKYKIIDIKIATDGEG